MSAKQHLTVMFEKSLDGGDVVIHSVYKYKSNAESVLGTKRSVDSEFLLVEVPLDDARAPKAKKAKTISSAPAVKKAKATKCKADSVIEDNDEDEIATAGEDSAPKANKSLAEKKEPSQKIIEHRAARKAAPPCLPDALRDMKLLFVGSFAKDKVALETAARTAGAELVKTPAEADYVVQGRKPGNKNEEAITKCGTQTVDETAFFNMLLHGASPQKPAREFRVDSDE